MTRIEIAQRNLFESLVMGRYCISKNTLTGMRTPEGYRNSTVSGRDYNRMWHDWLNQRGEFYK